MFSQLQISKIIYLLLENLKDTIFYLKVTGFDKMGPCGL